MALTPPDTDDLLLHMRREDQFSTTELEWAEDSIQRATDLMQLATGLETEPEDEVLARTLSTGILAMAHMIFTTSGEDRDALYSPYSSERLGSYSYSKAQQDIAAKRLTGVPEFDYAVGLFLITATENAMFTLDSEVVFEKPYGADDVSRIGRDPVLRPGAWSE